MKLQNNRDSASVGRVVASHTRGPKFKYSYQPFFILNMFGFSCFAYVALAADFCAWVESKPVKQEVSWSQWRQYHETVPGTTNLQSIHHSTLHHHGGPPPRASILVSSKGRQSGVKGTFLLNLQQTNLAINDWPTAGLDLCIKSKKLKSAFSDAVLTTITQMG